MCPLIFRVFSFVYSSLTSTREASLLRTEFPLFFPDFVFYSFPRIRLCGARLPSANETRLGSPFRFIVGGNIGLRIFPGKSVLVPVQKESRA